ncbi:hypothetical protein B0H14DRAFT_2580335 [Mycena olivaceomarginata]|nr:hypothetical protein B0H14DRAFT_2580335 [Mycena olivaceomarginata]
MSNLNGRSGRRVRISAQLGRLRRAGRLRGVARAVDGRCRGGVRLGHRRRRITQSSSTLGLYRKEREETNGGGGDIHGARRSAPPSSRDRASAGRQDGLRVVAATKGAGPRGELVGPSSQWVRGHWCLERRVGAGRRCTVDAPALSEASGHLGAGCAPGRGVGRPGPVAPSSSAAGARCGRGMAATPTTQARAARAPTPARPAAPPAQTQAEDGDRQLALVVQVGVPVSGGVDVHHIESGATRGKGEGREDQGRRGERAVEGRGHLEGGGRDTGVPVRPPSTSCPFPVRMAGGATSMVQGSMGETKKARKFHLLMPGNKPGKYRSRRWAPYLNVLALALPHCPAQRTTEMPLGACARAGGAVGHGHHAGHDNHTRPYRSAELESPLDGHFVQSGAAGVAFGSTTRTFGLIFVRRIVNLGRHGDGSRRRTQAQARERAKIYRLDPADQICALLAIEEDHVRYFREGPGTVYFTAQHDDGGQLIVKWGRVPAWLAGNSNTTSAESGKRRCGSGRSRWGGDSSLRVIRLALIGKDIRNSGSRNPARAAAATVNTTGCAREARLKRSKLLRASAWQSSKSLRLYGKPFVLGDGVRGTRKICSGSDGAEDLAICSVFLVQPPRTEARQKRTFARVGGEVAEQAGALRSVGRWAGGVDTSGSDCEHLRASGRRDRAGGDVEEWRPVAPQARAARGSRNSLSLKVAWSRSVEILPFQRLRPRRAQTAPANNGLKRTARRRHRTEFAASKFVVEILRSEGAAQNSSSREESEKTLNGGSAEESRWERASRDTLYGGSAEESLWKMKSPPLIWRLVILHPHLVLHDAFVVQHQLPPHNPATTERFRSVVAAFSSAALGLCDVAVVQTKSFALSRPEKHTGLALPRVLPFVGPLIRRPHIAYLVLHDECVVQHLLPRNPWTTEHFRSVVSAFGLSRQSLYRSYKAYSAGSPPSPAFVGEHNRDISSQCIYATKFTRSSCSTRWGFFFVFACERHLPPRSRTKLPLLSVGNIVKKHSSPSLPPPLSPQLRTALLACTPRHLDALPTYRPFSVDLPPDTPSFQAHALPGRLHPRPSRPSLPYRRRPTLAFGDSVFTHYPLFLAYTARSLPAAWPIPRSLDLNALLFSAVIIYLFRGVASWCRPEPQIGNLPPSSARPLGACRASFECILLGSRILISGAPQLVEFVRVSSAFLSEVVFLVPQLVELVQVSSVFRSEVAYLECSFLWRAFSGLKPMAHSTPQPSRDAKRHLFMDCVAIPSVPLSDMRFYKPLAQSNFMCTQTEEDTPTPPWIKNIRRVYLRLPQNPGDPDIRVHHPGPAGSVAEALNNMFAKNGNVGCTSAFSAPPSPLHTPASVILPQGQGNNEGDVNMQAYDDDMIDQLASDEDECESVEKLLEHPHSLPALAPALVLHPAVPAPELPLAILLPNTPQPAHVHTLASASVPTPPLASFSEKPGSDLSDRLSAIEEQMGQMMGAVSTLTAIVVTMQGAQTEMMSHLAHLHHVTSKAVSDNVTLSDAMVVDIRQTAERVARDLIQHPLPLPYQLHRPVAMENHPVLRGDKALETQQSTKYIKETVEGQQLLHIVPETHGQQPTQSIKVPQLSEEEGPHIETKTGTFRQRKVTRFGPRLDIAPIPSLPSFL